MEVVLRIFGGKSLLKGKTPEDRAFGLYLPVSREYAKAGHIVTPFGGNAVSVSAVTFKGMQILRKDGIQPSAGRI